MEVKNGFAVVQDRIFERGCSVLLLFGVSIGYIAAAVHG